jgi:hypothetical protein
MKIPSYLAACLLVLTLNLAFAQPGPNPSSKPPTEKDAGDYVWVKVTNSLPHFDLNFPGGTPRELVKAVEKATGKPLNTIIPEEYADLKIPAVSVKSMTVAQLFEVLIQASKKTERFIVLDPRDRSIGGNGSDVFAYDSTYGFRTEGVPAENSIWYFYWDRGDRSVARAPWQVISSTVCKFYQLEPYLEAGYTVEDITTAVETSWKMLGVTKPPQITYHKDTKVLIAVGEEDKVKLIGDVLKQLSQGKPKEKSANGQAEKTKTE